MLVIIPNNPTMAEALEHFRNELMTYYPDYLLHADFTDNGKLLLLAKPFVDLDVVMQELCDEMVALVNFRQHLDIYLYRFGENDLIEISIN